jgi:hypothetical protein
MDRNSERILRRLRAGLVSELQIDLHLYGAAQDCRYRQNIPRGLPRGGVNQSDFSGYLQSD